MTVTALILLAATAVVGAILWYVVDRRRTQISVGTALLAAAGPVLLLGGAALFALGGTPATGVLLGMAVAAGVAAAAPGGGLLAVAVLRLADRAPRTREGPHRRGNGQPAASMPEPLSVVPLDAPLAPVARPETTHTDATSTDAGEDYAAAVPEHTSAVSDPETLRGGSAIGALERVAIVVTLLARWPEGLALTLAIKGFGRYPELRKPSAPERFIIGTFASILWAVAVTGVVVAMRS